MVSYTPRLLYPRGKKPRYYWIGGWVVVRDGLDAVAKRKIPSPRYSNCCHSARRQVIILTDPSRYGSVSVRIVILTHCLWFFRSPSSVEVKNVCRYTSTAPCVFMASCLVKHVDNFTFTFTLIECIEIRVKQMTCFLHLTLDFIIIWHSGMQQLIRCR
jgi:hypothetical protein